MLKVNENNDQKKYKKNLLKYNTDYNKNKNKNILPSFISKKNIISKLKEEKDEIMKNKSNINLMNNNQNLKMKKYLTSINDKIKSKNNTDLNKNDTHRKSINYNSNKNNNKNMTKQLYINEITYLSSILFI